MERLQKKCFVGSLASHGILIVVLAVGTAMGPQTFKPIKDQEQHVDIKLIDIQGLTDGPSQVGGGGGGGSPTGAAPAQAPASAPQPTPPPPQPEPVTPPPAVVEAPKPPPMEAVVVPPPDTRTSLRPPETQKKKAEKSEPKKEAKSEPKKEAKTEPKKEATKAETKKVVVNLATVDRNKMDAKAKQKAAADAEKSRQDAQRMADAKAIRDARSRQAAIDRAIGNTIRGLNEGLSQSGGGLDVASFGAGSGTGWGIGNGPTLMNYAQYVREIYDLNWIVPDNVIGDTGIVRVEVVVQRNGAARGKIVKRSGNAQLDQTVQKAGPRTAAGHLPSISTYRPSEGRANLLMSVKRILLAVALCAAIFGVTESVQAQGTVIDLTRDQTITAKETIPVFMTGASGEIGATLKFDLEVLGFEFVAPDKARFEVKVAQGDGLEGRLIHVGSKQQVVGKRFAGNDARRLAHAFADEIVQAVRGGQGIAQTRIAFKGEIRQGYS
ncbi:MAG: hypothetical protein K0Q55_3752, partial [Verrucomicrobia bacterium]|nr:hypothetical protein [Verrucomicrobiota bacterium]